MESSTADLLVRGGMWDRQRLLGGPRLTQEIEKGESFILWDLSVVGDVEVEEGKTTPKAELTVSRLSSPDESFQVGTLSKAIVELAAIDRQEGDLPVVAHWEEVETKRALQPAVVIVAERRYLGE